ncbi:hypothetical protein B0H19DRAFT_1169338, partial [Mycena capillaripes]
MPPTCTTDLSLPQVSPSEETIELFWRKISSLTTRTRNHEGQWIGSPEVMAWNALNMQTCDKCCASRTLKACIIEQDQPSCLPCRNAKMACDRKTKFLFDTTCNDFFPTMEIFMSVFKARDQQQCRSYLKTANKQRKANLPYASVPKNKPITGPSPAIAFSNREQDILIRDLQQGMQDHQKRIQVLEEKLVELELAAVRKSTPITNPPPAIAVSSRSIWSISAYSWPTTLDCEQPISIDARVRDLLNRIEHLEAEILKLKLIIAKHV